MLCMKKQCPLLKLSLATNEPNKHSGSSVASLNNRSTKQSKVQRLCCFQYLISYTSLSKCHRLLLAGLGAPFPKRSIHFHSLLLCFYSFVTSACIICQSWPQLQSLLTQPVLTWWAHVNMAALWTGLSLTPLIKTCHIVHRAHAKCTAYLDVQVPQTVPSYGNHFA